MLKVGRGQEVAYLKLPDYPASGICKVSKSVRLFDLMGAYRGQDVVLDFDVAGLLVGIELIAD